VASHGKCLSVGSVTQVSRAGISRRGFLKAASGGMLLAATSPWSVPWASAGVSGLVRQYDASVPDAHARNVLRLIASTPGFTPPVASRLLAYFGVVLYESLWPGMGGYRTLNGLFPGFPVLPTTPRSGLHWPTVANHALGTIVSALLPAASTGRGVVDALVDEIDRGHSIPGPLRRRSIERGVDVAEAVRRWAAHDGGHEGHLHNFPPGYQTPTGPGLWEPTPPGFQSVPLQPFWGDNRRFADKSCAVPSPPSYSNQPDSEFFAYAAEVYDTSLTLTPEQKAIAVFWADDPGTLTPPGHSVSMLRQVIEAEDASLEIASEAYLRVGCALADAFIQCWKTKYQWNLLRPVTFIRANIDPEWRSLVTTPPFPEYSSGHSTQSAAWAEVMTAVFGDGYRFTDHAHDELGLPPRSFTSFSHAAHEAAESRLYGGIHYRFGNQNGLDAGICIGTAAAQLPLRS
jgi:hypothetical protein